MRSGTLNKKISIEKIVELKNEFGEVVPTWEAISTSLIPASIYPIRGTERYMSAGKHAEATSEINVRFFKGITPKHRIVWMDKNEDRERVFDIISTLNLGSRNKQLKIIVKEQV